LVSYCFIQEGVVRVVGSNKSRGEVVVCKCGVIVVLGVVVVVVTVEMVTGRSGGTGGKGGV
jgi:hypothetical protein